jgi:hypothetical protein
MEAGCDGEEFAEEWDERRVQLDDGVVGGPTNRNLPSETAPAGLRACCLSTTSTSPEALTEPGSSDVVSNTNGDNIATLATTISASESPLLTGKTSACKCLHLASSWNCDTSSNSPH